MECEVKPNFSHSILLSFVSGEDIQDRTDRVMLTPWVKFLWEAYRNVLELLRNNVRVEKLYHDTAQQGLFNSNIDLSILPFTSIDEIIIFITVISKTQGHTH